MPLFSIPLVEAISPQGAGALDILACSFSKIGLTLDFTSPEALQTSVFHNVHFEMTAAVLALDSFEGPVSVRDSSFRRVKIMTDTTLSIDTAQTSFYENVLITQRQGLLEQGIFVLRKHSKGFILAGN